MGILTGHEPGETWGAAKRRRDSESAKVRRSIVRAYPINGESRFLSIEEAL